MSKVLDLSRVAGMEENLERVVAKIVKMDWDNEKKGNAIAALSTDDVRKLRNLNDVLFEATLEAILAQGRVFL